VSTAVASGGFVPDQGIGFGGFLPGLLEEIVPSRSHPTTVDLAGETAPILVTAYDLDPILAQGYTVIVLSSTVYDRYRRLLRRYPVQNAFFDSGDAKRDAPHPCRPGDAVVLRLHPECADGRGGGHSIGFCKMLFKEDRLLVEREQL
jgi:hypothetical protein